MREKPLLPEFQTQSYEPRRRFVMNLAVDTKNIQQQQQQQEQKNERTPIEPLNPQSATMRSPKVFIIKHKKTPSQDLSAGLKRTLVENDSYSYSQKASVSTNENKSRKTSNASNDNSIRYYPNGEYTQSQAGLQDNEEGLPMQNGHQNYFDSIEENKSEKSGSGSPLSAKSRALMHKDPANNIRNSNHNNIHKKTEISLKQVVSDDGDQFMKDFSSLDFGDMQIMIGDHIGEGKLYKILHFNRDILFIRSIWCCL